MKSETNQQSAAADLGRQVLVNGICTNYHDVGAGAPVLLLHGSGPGVSAWANWRLTIPALAGGNRRVIAPDMIGFGYTKCFDDGLFSIERWVGHVIGLLDELSIEQVDVVGNSFGAAIALKIALEFPSRVNRVVLMGGVALRFELTDGLNKVWGYEPSLNAMRELLSIFAYDRTLVTDDLAELRYEASIRSGVHESYSAMFPEPRQRWVDELASSENELGRLTHEVLLVHGREDRVIPMEVSERAFRIIPKSEMHIFSRCGHWVQIEWASRFNDLVSSFLSG